MSTRSASAIERHVEKALAALGVERERVLVACSGGLDSMALLHLLVACAGARRLDVVVAHVDHGLRGAASEADRKHVEAEAAALGLACHVSEIDVEAARQSQSNRARPTLQEAARTLRYRALDEIARCMGASRIATAHHLDDQAETVLLRVLRGTSSEGLGGIPEASRDGRIVRPLLGLRRSELSSYARERGLCWREDASNDDPHYARNRLRADWLPGLAEAFNPNLAEALARLADGQRREREWLEPIVAAEFDATFDRIDAGRLESPAERWTSLPEALARRLVVRAVGHLGGGRELDRRHVERALAFLREGPGAPGGREIELPAPLRLRRERGRLIFYRSEGA